MSRLIDANALMDYCNNLKGKTIDANDIARFPTISTERLAKATAEAENWMKKAPYLCYDLAKELIAAAKEVTQSGNQ